MSFEMTALTLAWVAIILLALAVSGLLRQVRSIAGGRVTFPQRIGPVRGTIAPRIGQEEPRERPVLYLFMKDSCASCDNLMDHIPEIAQANSKIDVALVFAQSANGKDYQGLPVYENESDAFDMLGVNVTPFGVVVSPEGRVIAGEPVGSVGLLRRFLIEATERTEP